MKKKLLTIMACGLFAFTGVSAANATIMQAGTANYNGTDYNMWFEESNLSTGKANVWLDLISSRASYEDSKIWATNLGDNLTYNFNASFADMGYSWSDENWRMGGGDFTQNISHPQFSELGSMVQNADTTVFSTIMAFYWVDEQGGAINGVTDFYGSNSTEHAMYFNYSNSTSMVLASNTAFAMAVRSVDIAAPPAAPVPEPATMLLLGTGLAGLVGSAKRKQKKDAAKAAQNQA